MLPSTSVSSPEWKYVSRVWWKGPGDGVTNTGTPEWTPLWSGRFRDSWGSRRISIPLVRSA